MHTWSIGEVLWDIFPGSEQLGGAALNFCTNLQRLGDTATLVSAVGRDRRGDLALKRMEELRLSTRKIRIVDELPTGTAVVYERGDGETGFSIQRPAAYDLLSTNRDKDEEVIDPSVDWLYFGTLLQIEAHIEEYTTRLAKSSPQLRCFYDVNLREGNWNLELVQRLSQLASIVKLNDSEARSLYHLTKPPSSGFSIEMFCRAWAHQYDVDVVCVTLGAAGCCILCQNELFRVPSFPVKVCDTVGSGDAFAAAFLHGYHRNLPIIETARMANALGALVATRAGATPAWSVAECTALASAFDASVETLL